MPIETQRLSPHGGLQCHDLLGLLSMQAYAVCRTAGGIASAYATGHEDVTFCRGEQQWLRTKPSHKWQYREISTAVFPTNQLRAAGRTCLYEL